MIFSQEGTGLDTDSFMELVHAYNKHCDKFPNMEGFMKFSETYWKDKPVTNWKERVET